MTPTQIATYRAALKEARESFNRATKRLSEITDESYILKQDLGRLRRTITALAAMCSEEPSIDQMGITDSCEEVMAEQRNMVQTNDVIQALEARGFDLSSQKNASASVHAILSRLARKGKIEKVEDELNGIFWKGPNFIDGSGPITDEDIPF